MWTFGANGLVWAAVLFHSLVLRANELLLFVRSSSLLANSRFQDFARPGWDRACPTKDRVFETLFRCTRDRQRHYLAHVQYSDPAHLPAVPLVTGIFLSFVVNPSLCRILILVTH